MPPKAPPPVKKKAPPAMPPLPATTRAKQAAAPRPPKTFSVAPWSAADEGEKVIIYGASGRGKTTLAAMAPNPVFIGVDDGGRRVRHPKTGEAIARVEGIETFDDVRAALAQDALFEPFASIVVDTLSKVENPLAVQWVIENIPHEKAGTVIHNIEDYGYGKGYTHLFDPMKALLVDLDRHVRAGRNVILLCQEMAAVIPNPGGSNYLEAGPKLYQPGPESKQAFSIRAYVCEWADHVLRLDYDSRQVVGARVDPRSGKEGPGKVRGSTSRVIYTIPTDPSFFAKTRTLKDPLISFDAPDDASLWEIMFPDQEA